MKAGNMRNIVTVMRPVTSTDSTGQETYTYTKAYDVYAAYERDGFAKDETGFIQSSGHENITFTLRFDPSITYNHRIIFNGLTYRITALDNVLNLRHELKLKCVAVDL